MWTEIQDFGCTLIWYECRCKDCNRAKELYEELFWRESHNIDARVIIKELEDMGYSV